MKKVLILLFVLLSFACSEDNDSSSEPNNTSTNSTSTSNQLAVGASANDLLSANKFTSTVIELVYVVGFEPTQQAINNFTAFLEQRTFKPSGITVQKREIPDPGLSPYSLDDLINVETTNRTLFSTDNQIAVWAFFANGNSSSNVGNSVVLGTAYRNTSFVIYEETIHDLSDSTFEPARETLETTVINHEFGHILGLTDLGSPMQQDHEDPDNEKHCDVDSCLMFWQAETGGIANMINGGQAPQLDAQCIADLQANGGK